MRPGDTFDRYRIEALLGEGGMGQVFRAFDPRLGRRIALKIVRPGGGALSVEATARLVREARAAAAFDHANVVSVFDAGESEGVAFVAMELVNGRTLRAFVGDTSIPVATRVRWLCDVARALGAAHKAGLVHRDVKPENVMIRDDGGVKVLDFGIARRSATSVDPTGQTDAGHLPTITRDGVVVGTPLYMAPEQLRGDPVDGRADQFAWGVLAFELLTGKLPWKRTDDAVAVISAILSEPPPPLDVPGLGPGVPAVVTRALAKVSADRHVSMDDVVSALEASTSVIAATVAAPSIRQEPVRRTSRWPLVAAIGALGVVAASSPFWWPKTSSSVARPSASSSGSPSSEPPPKTSSPEALAAYRASELARRAGNVDDEVRLLNEAVRLDPTFAAAQLRLAKALVWVRIAVPAEIRGHAEVARRARDDLSPRDRELFDAVSPALLKDPPRYSESAARLAQVLANRPQDLELRLEHVTMLASARRYTEAAASARIALALDGKSTRAHEFLAYVLGAAGDVAGAEAALAECGSGADPAVSCIFRRMFIERSTGRCDAMGRDARELIVAEATSYRAFIFLAEARASLGAPIGELSQLVAQASAHAPADQRPRLDAGQAFQLALVDGRFEDVATMAEKRRDATRGDNDLWQQVSLAAFDVVISLELGDNARAARVAKDLRARSAAMQPIGRIEDDRRAFLLGVEARAGLVSREEQRKILDGWDADWRERLEKEGAPPLAWERWAVLEAAGADTEQEAKAALARRPPGEPTSFALSPLYMSLWYGRALHLAGLHAEALPYLRAAVRDCDGLQGAFLILPAQRILGDALAQTGDPSGACAEYAGVLARWGQAKPRSATAEAARAGSVKAGCPR